MEGQAGLSNQQTHATNTGVWIDLNYRNKKTYSSQNLKTSLEDAVCVAV